MESQNLVQSYFMDSSLSIGLQQEVKIWIWIK